MNFSLFSEAESKRVSELFKSVFSASEGDAEGEVISKFVAKLIATTQPRDLIGCIAKENKIIVGCIFFSRFMVPSGQVAFILSPVAVSTNVQGAGIGQKLIEYGLDHLRFLGASLAFTYGDPSFYCKTGFKQIDENIVKAPYALSQPVGWLAQALDGSEVQPIAGATKCVEALNDPKLW